MGASALIFQALFHICLMATAVVDDNLPLPPKELFSPKWVLVRTLFRNVEEIDDSTYTKISNFIFDDENFLHQETGFTRKEFDLLYQETFEALSSPLQGNRYHRSKLSEKEKLLMVLIWIHRYYTLRKLRCYFGLNESTVDRHINNLVINLSEFLRPEIQWPSPERLNLLQGIYPDYPDVVGSMDFFYRRIRMPGVEEHIFFRGDKGFHGFNHLGMVDFTGSYLHFEPGYGGRILDQVAFGTATYKQTSRTVVCKPWETEDSLGNQKYRHLQKGQQMSRWLNEQK